MARKIPDRIRGGYRIVYRIVDIYRIDILTVYRTSRLLTKSSFAKEK